MFVRNPFNYDADAASLETSLLMTQPSLAQQQFKDEVDVNNIARQFGLTGRLPTPVYMPTFEDFLDVEDFQGALHAIQRADASFHAMPAKVRERFQNDPTRFVEFCSDARNREEAAQLGLMRDAPPVVPPSPDPVNP